MQSEQTPVAPPAPPAPAAAPIKVPLDAMGKQEAIDALLRGGASAPAVGTEPIPEKVEQGAGEIPADPEAESIPEGGQVDYALEVPLASGEKVTLGKLKDAYQEQAQAILALSEREQAVDRKLDELRELADVLQALPPEKVEQKVHERREYARTQHQAMLEVIPAWQDPAKFEAGRKAIHDLAAGYGPVAQRLAGQVLDAPIVKMLHDFASLKAAVKAAGQIKPTRHPEPAAGRPTMTPQTQTAALIARAKQSKSEPDQQAAISAILKR